MGKLTKGALTAVNGILDMAHDARMARAREMGFDTEKTWYHGTMGDVEAFDPAKIGKNDAGWHGRGVYVAENPDFANKYAGWQPEYIDVDEPELGLEDFNPRLLEAWNGRGLTPNVMPVHVRGNVVEVKGQGNYLDQYPEADALSVDYGNGHKEMVVRDPSNIRSTNAAFDPAKKDSSNLLASLAGGGVLTGAMLPSEEAEASFIGPLARTFNRAALDVAQQLEKRGATRDEIWRETGQLGSPTFKDVDGHWKQEIDDSGYALDPQRVETRSHNGVEYKAANGSVVQHPGLQEAYPDFFNNLTVGFNPKLDSQGSYSSISGSEVMGWPQAHFVNVRDHATPGQTLEQRRSNLNEYLSDLRAQPLDEYAKEWGYDSLEEAARDREKDITEALEAIKNAKADPFFRNGTESTVLHEVQHGVQNVEGFARGGDPVEFVEDLAATQRMAEGEVLAINQQMSGLAAAMDKVRGSGVSPESKESALASLNAQYNELMAKRRQYQADMAIDPKMDAVEQYRQLAGEAEARNVQTRMNMDMGQRLAQPPWQTLDVPEDKLIVRGNKAPALATLATTGALSLPTTAQEAVQATGPDRGTIANQLLALSQQGDANPDVIQNLNGSPLLVQLANGLESNTQSPLGESHVQGIVDLLRKWGYREQASPLDYGMAALDVAP